ncbi:hypothetical protein RirG_271280 [Rhizophagus irregularis DAOM 197198w]|uniref:Uncharacterized protein n=1 Tax=Rhizophagus irregularis (strain DAOM 197198w) TaxID=1432141 RepID=A0A015JTE2_RHIIW|nr:hypothetical protein RirG_271280 [Rhizophagus irregularis DAOM 197198w]
METGILPSKDNESDEESNDGEDDVNAIIKLIEKEDQKDLEDVICPIKNMQRLRIFDHIKNVQYHDNCPINVNNDCFLLDDEIVETVPSADDLQNEEEIIPVISLTEALINVET